MLLTFIKRVFGIKTVDTTPAAPYKIEPPIVVEGVKVTIAPAVVAKAADLGIDTVAEVKSAVTKAKKSSVKKTAAKKAPSEKKPATKRAKKTTE